MDEIQIQLTPEQFWRVNAQLQQLGNLQQQIVRTQIQLAEILQAGIQQAQAAGEAEAADSHNEENER